MKFDRSKGTIWHRHNAVMPLWHGFLSIDDAAQIRRLLRKVLERTGYEVIEASDGVAGIACYRRAPTDLILTDLCMPGKDGLEIIRELRDDFPEVKIIVIIRESRDILSTARALGVVRTLQKPCTLREIVETVWDVLAQPCRDTPRAAGNTNHS